MKHCYKTLLFPLFVFLFFLFEGCLKEKGVVVSMHPIASQMGINVLKEGGNAVDAAVATGLALGVVEQYYSGIGGGGFIVIRMADGTVMTIDGREKAPIAATRDMYLKNGEVNSELSQRGPLAVAVPGLLAAYEKALKLAGTKTLSELISPSIDVARNGFYLDDYYISNYKEAMVGLFKDPASSNIYVRSDGSPLKAGDKLIQSDLANTYQQIADEGIDYFYQGNFAQRLADYMIENGGLITYQDMISYQAEVREPVVGRYGNYDIIGMGPPSSGGVFILQILNMIEASGILEGKSSWSTESVFFVSRFMAKAFEDRSEHLGDRDFYPVPISLLTSKAYADSVVSRIMEREQSYNFRHEDLVTLEPEHTTNFSVIDQWGNAVAVNQTLNLLYGAKVTIPGTGVVLNSEMDDFSALPGSPNYFGLVGSEANAIEPGKRPLSSMSPTIIVSKKENRPMMILGGSGGPRILTAVLQIVVNYLDLNMSLSYALRHPRFHHQFKPDILFVEDSTQESMWSGQKKLGKSVTLRKEIGKVQAIGWSEEKQGYVGVSDPRLREGVVTY